MPRPLRLLPPAATILIAALALLELRGAGVSPVPLHNAFGRGPTLVLVHGLGSNPQHWLPAARRLARHFRVVLVELPGHGESDMPELFSLDQAADALDHVLAAEAGAPMVLVGHSVGGLVAAAEAIRHPERVRALVLIETMLKPQAGEDERAEMLRQLDDDYHALLRAAYLSFGRDSAQGMQLYREVAALDSNHVKPWIRLALTADLSERAAELRVPVLGVFAPHTWPPEEPWNTTAAVIGYSRVPDIEPARIAGSAHFVMLDQPAELARVIGRFATEPRGVNAALR